MKTLPIEKRVCVFDLLLVLIKKYTFSGKNLAPRKRFSSIKSQRYIFFFNIERCSNLQNIFPFGNPPFAKKIKRDSLCFDLLPDPFKSVYLYSQLKHNKGKEETIYIIDIFISFISFKILFHQQSRSVYNI